MPKFHSFVILAEMRTGSNFLETNLNALEGISCFGEAFNPQFIGYPNRPEILGIGQDARDSDPHVLLRKIKETPELSGFRYFHDHDPRVFDTVVDDPGCAKIILTRNPLDSYVSRKIAQATGQWKLTDAKARKSAKVQFDPTAFSDHLETLHKFQIQILHRLQVTGQTAFYVAYEDLQDLDVINGIAAWLGIDGRLVALDKTLKVQNPASLSDKVSNHAQMVEALTRIDHFDLTRTPNFEPRRGPAVPTYHVSTAAPLMYLPIRGGTDDRIISWLSAAGVAPAKAFRSEMSQKELRQWMRAHTGHRCFSLLRHPVARAHSVFCSCILKPKEGGYSAIRKTLKNRYNLPLPARVTDPDYDKAAHRAAFAAFLKFLKSNLAQQTAVRVDPEWASQTSIIEGFSGFKLPDRLMREETASQELIELARSVGMKDIPDLPAATPDLPYALIDIYDAEIENLTRAAYARDYLMFGFSDWNPA